MNIEEALERVQEGLGDREWDCMCDPGSHEDPCPFAALDTLRQELSQMDGLREENKYLRVQLERQEAACAHCAYCVMTQDASSVAPVVADGSATEERLEPEVSPRRSGPSNLARDAAGATPPNQEDMPCVCRDDEGSTPGDYGVHYHQEEARKK